MQGSRIESTAYNLPYLSCVGGSLHVVTFSIGTHYEQGMATVGRYSTEIS